MVRLVMPCVLFICLSFCLIGCGRPSEAKAGGGAAEGPAPKGDWARLGEDARARGTARLLELATDGKWEYLPGKGQDLGVTAMAVWGLYAGEGKSVFAKMKPTQEWIASFQKDDGAIFEKALATYITSAAVMGFTASGSEEFRDEIAKSLQFLTRIQADEAEGRSESSEDYGGIGYNSGGEAAGVVNMSTTHFALDAAKAGGLPKDSSFYSKALRFLERSQNRSESNPLRHKAELDGKSVDVVSGNDGGAIYRPGESKAGLEKLADGRIAFRSYGSMTYALLKSYILCDLDPKDPRVEAAIAWIAENWQLDYNPGMEHVEGELARYQGLYYYYLTLARALAVYETKKLPLPENLKGWREQLVRELVKRQRKDGSWFNEQDRWQEGSAALCTAYALIALEACLGPAR